jgi:sugar lactone lactonase YvrE
VAAASDGTVYVAADGRIRKITPDGTMTTVAGAEGEASFEPGGDGVPAVGEPLGGVGSIALAPDGNLVVSEQVGQIRRVTPAGLIELVAGTGEYDEAAGSGDGGPATAGALADNAGVTVGPDGTIYIAENSRVRRVTPDGLIDTIAGRDPQSCPPAEGDTGRAVDARVCIPAAVAVGPDGTVYVGDGNEVYRIGPEGSFEHVAGQPDGAGFSGDGGPAADATLQLVTDLAVAPDGTLYILDSCNHRVRRVGADGVITTVAGSGPVCPEKEYGR